MRAVLVKLALAALVLVPSWAQPTAQAQPGGPTPMRAHPAPDRHMTPGEIKIVQQHLKDLGFDPGPINGIFTAQTRDAVRAFQARYGLPVSGLLDRATRRELVPGLDIPRRR